MMTESIREGFNLANRNLQLVLIRIMLTVLNLMGLFIFLVVPIIIAVTYLGFDMTHMKELIPFFLRDPFDLISKYLGLIFITGISFLVYLMLSTLLFLYVLGGILGVLRNSAVYVQYRFSTSSFFKEANRGLSGLVRLVLVLSFIFLLVFIAFIASGGIAAAAMQAFSGQGTSLETFFSSFIAMSVLVFSAIIFMAVIMFSVYSMVVLTVERKGAVDSVKMTFDFLKERPGAFVFYMVLFAVVIAVNLMFFLLKIPFSLMPDIAPFFAVFISLLNTFFQSYIAVFVWSSLIVYYVKCTNYPVYSATYEI